jgi:hypothetical protein
MGSRSEPPLGDGRPARAQMIALAVLGFVLVAVPLYLWRRPRPVPVDANPAPPTDLAAVADAGMEGAAPTNGVRLTDPMILECHDPGPKRTAPDQCGHLPAFEKAFAKSIADAAACVPPTAGGGNLVYVADVSYGRPKNRSIILTLPKDGRTVKGRASQCESAVEHTLKTVELDAEHAHSRYKIQITATYP